MKRVIQFSKGYIPAAILSTVLIVAGIVGYAVKGFNYGVDFQAGINQTVQLAYPALDLTYAGQGNVELTVEATKATIVFSGSEVENRTLVFNFADTPTIDAFASALNAVPDLHAEVREGQGGIATSLLVPTFQGNTKLGTAPVLMHRAPANEGESFADPLRESKTCDAIVVNMIDVGEETGELDAMLLKIADNYDEEVDVAVASLVSLLEPMMVVVIGLMVGTIVVSMFLPMVAMIESLQGGGAV